MRTIHPGMEYVPTLPINYTVRDSVDTETDPGAEVHTWTVYANGGLIGRVREVERGYLAARTDQLGWSEFWTGTPRPFHPQALDDVIRQFESNDNN